MPDVTLTVRLTDSTSLAVKLATSHTLSVRLTGGTGEPTGVLTDDQGVSLMDDQGVLLTGN